MLTKLGQVTEETKGCNNGVDPDGSDRFKLYTDGDSSGPLSINRTAQFPFTAQRCG